MNKSSRPFALFTGKTDEPINEAETTCQHG
jgi:hypothetical protein